MLSPHVEQANDFSVSWRSPRPWLLATENAQALDALRGEATALEGKVDALIEDMQAAIDEADAFISRMRAG